MNKKKVCIESLAAQENHEPPEKLRKHENMSASTDDRPVDAKDGGCQGSKKSDYINITFFNDKMKSDLVNAFQNSKDYSDECSGVSINCSPFRHCVLPKFAKDEQFVLDLESSLLNLSLREKNNDLYKFEQSKDLVHNKDTAISTFRSLCETMLPFITEVTGIPLNSKIDLFCSQYKYSDTLLCHDDELEERRIAFIYYLVPGDWGESDGGALDLFSADELGQPQKVVKSILPKRNNFVFFEVSAKSFHQVAEVMSEEKTRLSVSGWFHGPRLARPPPHVESLPPAIPYGGIEESVFYSWFNPMYLAPDVQSDIRTRFEEDSEIELTDFLQPEKYKELTRALRSSSVNWNLVGPANKRKYYEADKGDIPPVLAEYLRVIQSDAVFLVLSNLTGLKLHSMAPGSDSDASDGAGPSVEVNPRCRTEVRRWEHGCYTLAHDTDTEMFEFALDTMLYVDCSKDWTFDTGGYTSYIVKGEDEQLLSVEPVGNSLALVYRDKSTMRFVKHLNHRITTLTPSQFYEVNAVYYE